MSAPKGSISGSTSRHLPSRANQIWTLVAIGLCVLVSLELIASPAQSIATINIWKHRYPFYGGHHYYPFWGGYGGYGGYGGISIGGGGYGRR